MLWSVLEVMFKQMIQKIDSVRCLRRRHKHTKMIKKSELKKIKCREKKKTSSSIMSFSLRSFLFRVLLHKRHTAGVSIRLNWIFQVPECGAFFNNVARCGKTNGHRPSKTVIRSHSHFLFRIIELSQCLEISDRLCVTFQSVFFSNGSMRQSTS